jgi:hypothetical protein
MIKKTIKPKGRKPKNSTVEKRVQKLLVEGEEKKRPPGRPPTPWDSRPDHVKYIVDCAALGYSNTYIVNLLKERFGETAKEVVTISTIVSYKKRYAHEIERRERELRAELHMMLPSVRIRVLQRVVERSEDGIPVGVTKEGEVVKKPDHQSIIQAVKELNTMMRELEAQKSVQAVEIKAQREIAEQKAFIRETVLKIKAKNPEKTELEILRELSKSFTDEEDLHITEAFEQLTSEYKM